MRRALALLAFTALVPAAVLAQSAGEVERCFQNPAVCGQGGGQAGGGAAPAPSGGAPVAATRSAPAPDYTTVLQSPEPDRKHIQESLRTLDKYNGPIDGNLQSEATTKAISDWQKAHGMPAAGKLTPQEAQQLNAEASKAPIKRIEPPPQTAAAPTPAPSTQANADALKALQARLAERRKAAEPKAEAAAQSLIRDLKAYVAADGKGVAGDQFAAFAKWYADNKAAGRKVGEIAPIIDDYGDAKVGAAVASEILLETKQDGNSQSQCLVFAWVEGNPRKNAQAFSCDDVAAVEKWKTDQALKSAWR
jgi:peptidoglycan hydrolase-like protein with peptidoglycan-binding domain